MKIAITNNTGLRNRGCEALVTSMIGGLRRHLGGALQIQLHTNDPLYDAWRLAGSVTAQMSYLTLTPNHLSSITANRTIYRLLGIAEKCLPATIGGFDMKHISALRAADLILPTGGDVITSDYGNLRKQLSSVVMHSTRKVALIGHTIGPFTAADEKYFLKSVDNIFLITVRETESYNYLQQFDLPFPVYLTADVAFGLDATPRAAAVELLQRAGNINPEITPFVALSVSEGVIRYSGLDRDTYFREMVEFVTRINRRGYAVVLVPHVQERNPNNNDVIACEELYARLADRSLCSILYGELSAADFKGVIGLASALVGARTHATIAAMSQAIPTVSIAYSRKAYGIMADVFGEKLGRSLTIAASELSAEKLDQALGESLAHGSFESTARYMKDLAETNYAHLVSIMSSQREGGMQWKLT